MIIAQAFEHPATQPILDGLRSLMPGDQLELTFDSIESVEWNFLEKICDAALITPAGYASKTPDVSLLDGACVAAFGATNDLNLYFKPGLHHFKTVAAVGVSPADSILAQIVLREKYKMTPKVTVFPRSADEAVGKFDAVLTNGSEETPLSDNMLDITDEWFDMTQLPYVKYLFAGWKLRMNEHITETLTAAAQQADSAAVAKLQDLLDGSLSDQPEHQIPGHYRYVFGDEEQEGLDQFFRMAFFHGLNKDIPDVVFWQPETEENPPG